MYFKSFPYTLYSLDDLETTQVVTNIATRVVVNNEVKDNLSLFDEYDIKDGETPEIVADKFYNNPELHWLILHYNDILDARFGWPLSSNDLFRYASGKYNNIYAIHHYENANESYTNANVFLMSSNAFNNFNVNDAIKNNTNEGTGYITAKNSGSNIRVTVTTGGFVSGDQIGKASNVSVVGNVTSTVTLSGTPVTNMDYENAVNETKRRIRVLKAPYVDSVINDFKKKLGE